MALGTVLTLAIASAALGAIFTYLNSESPVPVLSTTKYWGPGEKRQDDPKIEKFQINIPQEALRDLNERLDNFLAKPITPPLEMAAGFSYGINTNYLKNVITYWRHRYNWTATQGIMNNYPHFRTQINGLKIHFTHIAPKKTSGQRVIPLLILHGWPGSFFDYYDLIPKLVSPGNQTDYFFELIIPSLPGFLFSEASTKPGMSPVEIGVLLNNLMQRIGIHKYYVHGGDWGAVIARHMSVLYPNTVLGVHSTMCLMVAKKPILLALLGSIYPSLVMEEKYQHLMYPIQNKLKKLIQELGYFNLQATKPDTIGAALADSPAGFAGYVLEKISAGTNPAYVNLSDGGLTEKFTMDTLLHNIMLYWLTNSITTSMRIYAEAFTTDHLALDEAAISVPSACARFPHEIAYFSDIMLRQKYQNLVHISDFPSGGHFSTLECSNEVAQDIITAIAKIEGTKKNEETQTRVEPENLRTYTGAWDTQQAD